jgi:hypothetical protein
VPRHSQEVRALTRQNNRYIDDNPIWIRLVPHVESQSPAGGKVRLPQTARLPQKVRLVPLDRQRTVAQSVQEFSSSQTEVRLQIIGMPDLEIEQYDQFELDDVPYEVDLVQPRSAAPYLRRATAHAIPGRGQ